MRLLCPAKINLHLRIGPVRDDGFHPLLSWFCMAGLFDTLILEQASPLPTALADPAMAPLDDAYIALFCDQPDLPCDRRNLVVKIGDAWAREALTIDGSTVFPVNAELRKRIPAGAGLGGGSSDGARTLLGLNRLWNAGREAHSLSGFAARFGSDLPFFFLGPSSVCTGRGEIVRPVPRPKPRALLLMLPAIHMPTAEVYRRFDAMKLGRTVDVEVEPDWSAWARLDARQLMEQFVNDLEGPAFAINPSLAELRLDLEKLLKRPVRMSGSGSSLFTIYDENAEADRARELIAQYFPIRVESVELSPEFVDDLNEK